MSWIKKLFQMFAGEGEEIEREHYETKKKSHEYSNDRNVIRREPEAKVLYQYPKGQFKFPLIPDSKTTERSETQSHRSQKKESPPVKSNPAEFEGERQEYVKPVKPVKIPVGNRQPFRPTETPSPVFAFSRPKTGGTIEYELNGFMKAASESETMSGKEAPGEERSSEMIQAVYSNEPSTKQQGTSVPPDLTKKGKTEEAESVYQDFQSAEIKEAPEAVGAVKEESLQLIASQPEEAALSKNAAAQEFNRVNTVRDSEMNSAGIMEQEAIQKEKKDSEAHELTVEVPRGTEQVILLPKNKGEAVESKGTAVSEDHSRTEIPVSEENPQEMTDSATELNTAFHQVSGAAASKTEEQPFYEEQHAAEAGLHEKAVVAEDSVPEEEPVQFADENEGDAVAGAATATSPKRNLPFNVLMLKQDRRRLNERKPAVSQVEEKSNTAESQEITHHAMVKTEGSEANSISEYKDIYKFPGLELLKPPVTIETSKDWLNIQEQALSETLKNFNVGAKVVNVTQGPSVTRFEVQPEPGVKVNKITNLADDIKLSLAARDIRMEAPIPGKHTIGIEVPNETSRPVLISEILKTGYFNESESPLAVALGLDIAGTPIVTDLKKMPHGLIAGATGSGKSVCINTMLVSLLYKAHPDDVKLLLIDPKMVELAPYNHIPHLVSPVITDVKAATASLKWAVEEMERRYELFAHAGVRDIGRFNQLAIEHERYAEKLPYIVIVIDELADLMMMSPADVEEAICRIAQKARACGIHLIIATQRPSVDVITGLIKANVPTRIAFSVSSQVDSRTIIDISGAEKLLGRGDMLFLENGSSKPFRLQGTFVSDQEIDDIVAFVRKQRAPQYLFEQDELIKKSQHSEEEDELFYEACEFVIEQGGASASSVQRRFKVGYNRAARLIEMMEQHGFISEGRGSKPRDVLISASDLESFQETSTL